MTSYSATFSNGSTKRIGNSKRAYTHAWAVHTDRFTKIGFAADADKAARAAAAYGAWLNKYARKDYRISFTTEVIPAEAAQ